MIDVIKRTYVAYKNGDRLESNTHALANWFLIWHGASGKTVCLGSARPNPNGKDND